MARTHLVHDSLARIGPGSSLCMKRASRITRPHSCEFEHRGQTSNRSALTDGPDSVYSPDWSATASFYNPGGTEVYLLKHCSPSCDPRLVPARSLTRRHGRRTGDNEGIAVHKG